MHSRNPTKTCYMQSLVCGGQPQRQAETSVRYLNQFLHKDHFKYEDLRIAMLMFEKDDYLIKFDLKSGYHHLDIFEVHQTYLGFSWPVDQACFKVLFSLFCHLGWPLLAMPSSNY